MQNGHNVLDSLIALADQKNNRVVIYNTNEFGKVVWEWTTSDESFQNVSDIKLRRCEKYGLVIVVCSSYGYVGVIKYPEKIVIWETKAEGNVHSVELLPDMRVAIAASDGNYIRVYSTPDEYIQKDLYQAHGVLWDPDKNVLWALGIDRLCAFYVSEDLMDVYKLSKMFSKEMTWGHDLAPVYGNKDLLWITTNEGVFQFNKETGEFNTDYKCNSLINGKSVKGVGNDPYISRVYIVYPNGTFLPWCTNQIEIIDTENNIKETYKSELDGYYKLRVFCERYQ